jgi:hypothetical protein
VSETDCRHRAVSLVLRYQYPKRNEIHNYSSVLYVTSDNYAIYPLRHTSRRDFTCLQYPLFDSHRDKQALRCKDTNPVKCISASHILTVLAPRFCLHSINYILTSVRHSGRRGYFTCPDTITAGSNTDCGAGVNSRFHFVPPQMCTLESHHVFWIGTDRASQYSTPCNWKYKTSGTGCTYINRLKLFFDISTKGLRNRAVDNSFLWGRKQTKPIEYKNTDRQ